MIVCCRVVACISSGRVMSVSEASPASQIKSWSSRLKVTRPSITTTRV